MQPRFKCIIFYPTLVVPTILETRGRLGSCEKKTLSISISIINTLCTLNLTRQSLTLIFDEETSVVVVIIDGPMHFYLG